MALTLYNDPELVIAQNRKVIFLNPNDKQIFKIIEIPSDLTTLGLTPFEATPDAGEPAEPAAENTTPSIQSTDEVTIKQIAFSVDRQLFALTTTGQKALLIYKCRMEHGKLLSVRPLARASSALAIANDGSSVLVTDKTGDCYEYDCVNVTAPPRLLLGLLSIIYDIVWTPDKKRILTCDRDDKIRVTKYPETYIIDQYCLGHTEFVSSLALLGDDCVISVSGDKTLRIWNFTTGKELNVLELPAPGIKVHLFPLAPTRLFQIAVLFYNHKDAIGLYELEQESKQVWQIRHRQYVQTDADSWNISQFTQVGDRTIVVGEKDERFALRIYNSNDGMPDTLIDRDWLQMVEDEFPEKTSPPEDVSTWFKKRYDNVSEYMERKKRRIEEQQKK